MSTEILSAGEAIVIATMKDRRLNTAKNLSANGWVRGRERRESVLRTAKNVITETRKKSLAARLKESVTVSTEPAVKRKRKQPSVLDVGHRFISIATAASVLMGVLFVTEQVTGIIDSAHAQTVFGKLIR